MEFLDVVEVVAVCERRTQLYAALAACVDLLAAGWLAFRLRNYSKLRL